MSRSSKNTTKNNNLKTSQGRFVTKRSARVFDGGNTKSVVDSVFLYQLVFKSKKAVFMALFLCFCFATQSVKLAQASEEDVAAQEQVQTSEVVTEQVPEMDSAEKSNIIETEEESENENPDPDPEPESEVSNSGSETEANLNTESTLTSDQQNLDAVQTTNEDSSTATQKEIEPGARATTTDVVEAESSTSTSSSSPAVESGSGATTATTATSTTTDSAEPEANATSTSTENDAESSTSTTETQNASSSDELNEDDESSDTSDSVDQSESDNGVSANEQTTEVSDLVDDEEEYVQEPPTKTNENLVFTVESDTQFSFDKNECTRIEDGTFYCQERDTKTVLEDSLIAAPDSDGDLEIYLVRDGERYQITQNEIDDASPYYDELSNTIVWHRLLNDRYQIISYDIESGEEEQLTQTSINNMEPARHGEYTVWQRWVENNWEVILYDGKTESQITDSARHDIAPHIRGPLVIWNSQSNDGSQELRTFDIQSRTQTTIADNEGVSVSNPRMVVMYEAMYENGDIVTKGFDLVSGKVVPLQALPQELPDELPNSEPTEETRALIQSKPEPKATAVANVQTTGGNGTSTATTSVSSAENATSSAETLDLRAMSTPELIKHLTEADAATSTIRDNVIESGQSGTTTQSEAEAVIPDLVIPPAESGLDTSTSTQNIPD